jgi:hypothetical protein
MIGVVRATCPKNANIVKDSIGTPKDIDIVITKIVGQNARAVATVDRPEICIRQFDFANRISGCLSSEALTISCIFPSR